VTDERGSRISPPICRRAKRRTRSWSKRSPKRRWIDAGVFRQGHAAVEDLQKGLREELRDKKIFPVLLSSALHNIGSDAILNFCAEIFPSPAVRGKATGHTTPQHPGEHLSERMERNIADSEPLSIFAFKTIADPFAGRISYFKVLSGVLKNDATPPEFQSQLPGASATRAGDARQDRH